MIQGKAEKEKKFRGTRERARAGLLPMGKRRSLRLTFNDRLLGQALYGPEFPFLILCLFFFWADVLKKRA